MSSQACWLRCQPPFQHPCSTGSPSFQLPAWASCFAGPGRCLADPSSGLSPGNPPQAWLLASYLCHCPLPGASQTSRCPLWLEPLVVKCWTGSSGFLGVWLRLRPAFRASLGPPAASPCCTFLSRLAWYWGWGGVFLPPGLGSVLAAAELEGRTAGTSWTWQPWVCSQLGDLRLADPSEPRLRCGARGDPCCPHVLVWGMWPCTGPKLLALSVFQEEPASSGFKLISKAKFRSWPVVAFLKRFLEPRKDAAVAVLPLPAGHRL